MRVRERLRSDGEFVNALRECLGLGPIACDGREARRVARGGGDETLGSREWGAQMEAIGHAHVDAIRSAQLGRGGR